MKGSKRDRWVKDGMRDSKKFQKKFWKRSARHCKDLANHNFYRRLSGCSAWKYIP